MKRGNWGGLCGVYLLDLDLGYEDCEYERSRCVG